MYTLVADEIMILGYIDEHQNQPHLIPELNDDINF